MSGPGPARTDAVPVRTIAATIGMVIAAAVLLLIVRETARVIIWIVIAVLFAVAVHPAVDWVDRRVPRCPRSLAALLVFLLVVAVVVGIVTAIVVPLSDEARRFAHDLPRLVDDVRAGRGPLGHLLQRVNGDEWLQRNQDKLTHASAGLATPALGFLRAAATGLVALVTIFTLAFLMVVQGPRLIDQGLALLPRRRAERVRRVGAECSRTITGYVTGNLVISAICGTLTYLVLKVCGVPFAGLIALFVAIVDLVPLVGATIGAVVAVLAGLAQSVQVAIVVAVFFVIYQQLENHLLQPLIYSRTVQLNPLAVLIAVLVFGELAGVLGTLFAIPAAGIIHAILRDVLAHRPPPDGQSTPGPAGDGAAADKGIGAVPARRGP